MKKAIKEKISKLAIIKEAFPKTIPVLTGYIFLGITYGIYMRTSGFPWYLPSITALLVFSGAAEFTLVSLLMGVFNPLQALILGLTLGARHIFYGITMLDKYKNTGKKKIYLMYALTDETFSLNCSLEEEDEVKRKNMYFCTSLLDQSYWFIGVTIGGILGSFITISVKGLDFVMTVMFVVIFLDNLLKEKNYISSVLGIVVSAIALVIVRVFSLGSSSNFIIPSLCGIVLILTIFWKPIEKFFDKRKGGNDKC